MLLTGKGLVEYCRSKLGTPYFFGAKMEILTAAVMNLMHRLYPGTVTDKYILKAKNKGQVGKENTDCSGLPGAYRKKQIGSAQLYQTAYARLSVNEYKKWADGVIPWRQGHVGVFAKEDGKYYVYEAKGIDYGTIKSVFDPAKWTCGLTFQDIVYDYSEPVENKSWKTQNPYREPTTNLKIGTKGEGVKWLQWELCEAGYDLAIDGELGPLSDTALRSFQKSCKIECDGICGPVTRRHLKADGAKQEENYTFGVDVAKWNGMIDWAKVFAAGKRFAVLKITRRDNQIEDAFDRNYIGCGKSGIAVAVYRYVYATSVLAAETEAKGILKALNGRRLDGEIWLDMEDKSISRIGKAALTLIIDKEAEILRKAGYRVGVYCNADWFRYILDSAELSKRYKFWIAKYGENDGSWQGRSDDPKKLGAIGWQYTSKGRVDGISGDVDLDLIY